MDTCDAIACHLLAKYVKIPQEEYLQQVIDGFEQQWGFPQTVGTIDGTYVGMCIRLLQSKRVLFHAYTGSSG